MTRAWHGRAVAGGRVANGRAGRAKRILKPNVPKWHHFDVVSVLYNNARCVYVYMYIAHITMYLV